MNEYLETLRVRAERGDKDAAIRLDFLSVQIGQENQRAIAAAELRGWHWRIVNGRVQSSNVPFDFQLLQPPKDWTQVVEVEPCPTFDRIHCIDGTLCTTESDFVKVGDRVRVRRRRVEVRDRQL